MRYIPELGKRARICAEADERKLAVEKSGYVHEKFLTAFAQLSIFVHDLPGTYTVT